MQQRKSFLRGPKKFRICGPYRNRPEFFWGGRADPAVVPKMKISEIQANPEYIDNNFKSMSFYGAEEADITYTDGAVLRIGLVPQLVKAPFVTVDYHNARSEFASWNKSEHDLRFVPQIKSASATPGSTFGEVLEKFSVPVTFAVDWALGKIVPNHVNPVTAPKLCAWLLAAEAEYIKNFDNVAKGMIVILEKMKLIIELQLLRSSLPKGIGPPRWFRSCGPRSRGGRNCFRRCRCCRRIGRSDEKFARHGSKNASGRDAIVGNGRFECRGESQSDS